MTTKAMKILANVGILIFVLGISGAITFFITQGNENPELYPKTAVVVEVNKEEGIVACEDCGGDVWELENVEGFAEGDILSLLMDSKNTEDIHDDEIVDVVHSGDVEGLR